MKNKSLFHIMWAIALVFFNVCVFVIAGFTDHTAVFWLTYVFTLIAFAVVEGSTIILGRSGMHMRDWLFGYPIIRYCVIYSVAELVLAIVFFVLEEVVSWQLAFVVQFALVAFYSFMVISCIISKKTIDQVHNKVQKDTKTITLMRVDAEMLVSKCTDPDARKVFAAFSEKVRYSDPVSHEAVVYLENRLKAIIADAKAKLEAGLITEAMDLCNSADLLLEERNMKVKAMKGR